MYVYFICMDLHCSKEISIRVAKALGNLNAMTKKSKSISLQTKTGILRTCVFSSFLYASETWVISKQCERRILAFEQNCYRKVLSVRWTQRATNEDLYKRVQLRETLLQKVIQRELQLFHHICRMDDRRMTKT